MSTITKEYIESLIAAETFSRPTNSTLTICVLTLKSGATVVGKCDCINPAEFDDALFKRAARQDAIDKLWGLETYAIKRNSSTLVERSARAIYAAQRLAMLEDGDVTPSFEELPPETRSEMLKRAQSRLSPAESPSHSDEIETAIARACVA